MQSSFDHTIQCNAKLGFLIQMVSPLAEIASNIELREDGLWMAKSLSPVSFPAEGNQHCFAIEDSSFWFQHRNDCILELLRRFPPSGTFFDIGGGNGYVTRAVERAGFDTVLIEPGLEGVRNARRRGVRQVIWGTVEDAGLLPERVPAIGLFDVLEHVEEDARFLGTLYTLQQPGGRLYLTAPAFSELWSHEDKIAGHWRRYRVQDLSRKLTEAGYKVEFASYFFEFLVLPIWAFRVIPHRLGLGRNYETEASVRSDHEWGSGMTRKILGAFRRRELGRICAGKTMSRGASCLLACSK